MLPNSLPAAGSLLQEDLHHVWDLWLQLRGVSILYIVLLLGSLGWWEGRSGLLQLCQELQIFPPPISKLAKTT